MSRRWPTFVADRKENGVVTWFGAVKPRAQVYAVQIVWWPGTLNLPLSFVVQPTIEPPPNSTYEQIPHLIFNPDRPEQSALCLFDPNGSEWSPLDLIADTTVEWTCEWLHYYELWHATGEWLGTSVNHEIVNMPTAQAEVFRKAIDSVH